MVMTVGDGASSYSMVRSWVAEPKHARKSTEVEYRLGHPVEVAGQEIVDQVHEIMMKDRQATIRHVA